MQTKRNNTSVYRYWIVRNLQFDRCYIHSVSRFGTPKNKLVDFRCILLNYFYGQYSVRVRNGP